MPQAQASITHHYRWLVWAFGLGSDDVGNSHSVVTLSKTKRLCGFQVVENSARNFCVSYDFFNTFQKLNLFFIKSITMKRLKIKDLIYMLDTPMTINLNF